MTDSPRPVISKASEIRNTGRRPMLAKGNIPSEGSSAVKCYSILEFLFAWVHLMPEIGVQYMQRPILMCVAVRAI
jgi:hypothetical protein